MTELPTPNSLPGQLSQETQATNALLEACHLIELNDYQSALLKLQAEFSKQSNNIALALNVAQIHQYLGQLHKAIEILHHVLSIDPSQPLAMRMMVVLLLQVKDLRTLHDVLWVYCSKNPSDKEAECFYALCQLQLENGPAARAVLKKILAENPHHELALKMLDQCSIPENA